jgi:predicted nucleic acid-binding protein
MIVIDASILVPILADDGPGGQRKRNRVRDRRLLAPALIDVEVLAVMRKAASTGRLGERRLLEALAALMALPLHRAAHTPLLPRMWALRHNVTAYDASYVALAEAMRVPLVTADARLASAPGIACEVELVS